MKNLIVWLFVFIAIQAIGQNNCKSFERSVIIHASNSEKQFKKLSDNYDLISQRLYLKIDPSILPISGQVDSKFKSLVSGLNALIFHLDDTMHVDSVVYHQGLIPFVHRNHIITINLPNSLSINIQDSISIFYSGDPTKSRFQAYQAEHHGKNSTLAPIVWTLSQPYGAQDWWPCKNTLDDKIDTLDIFITCPIGNKVASNGLLVKTDTIDNDLVRYHWLHQYPIVTYLVAIAITNYVEYTDTVVFSDKRRLPILNYVYPEYLSTAVQQTPELAAMIRLYDSLFGNYPFEQEKYGHAMFGRGGGMEHQTMSFMSNFNYDLMAHELAHQWFGDKITCNSWQDIWLNEGFATYLTALCHEFLKPSDWVQFMGDIKNAVLKGNDGSVFVNDTLQIGRIFDGRLSYNKGAMVLHMLRLEIGDSLFFAGMKTYVTRADFSYSFASTDALKNHFEEVTRRSLTTFFAQWIYGEGFPIYNIKWSQNEQLLAINITQLTSHTSVGLFHQTLPILLKGDLQERMIYLKQDNLEKSFILSNPFEVKEMIFDPYNQILAKSQIYNGGKLSKNILVYPNPANDKITFSALGKTILQIDLFDITGQKVMENNIDTQVPNESKTISVQDLNAGMYFFECHTNEGKVKGRFFKN